jgi:hypothetical protein
MEHLGEKDETEHEFEGTKRTSLDAEVLTPVLNENPMKDLAQPPIYHRQSSESSNVRQLHQNSQTFRTCVH